MKLITPIRIKIPETPPEARKAHPPPAPRRHYGEGHDINYAKALAKIRKFADPDIGERFNMQLDESFAAYAKNGYTAD